MEGKKKGEKKNRQIEDKKQEGRTESRRKKEVGRINEKKEKEKDGWKETRRRREIKGQTRLSSGHHLEQDFYLRATMRKY